MKNFLSALAIATCLTACQKKTVEELEADIQKELNTVEGRFAVAFKDLTTGETILINEDSIFHAASTMKVPVMIEVFKQAKEGKFSLSDSIEIKNEFKSIVDSSLYSLLETDDSDTLLYDHIGEQRSN